MIDLETIGSRARTASRALARCAPEQKNHALMLIAQALETEYHIEAILSANATDVAAARAAGMAPALLDRMLLDRRRIAGIAADVRQVAALADPVGEEFEARERPNGLHIHKRRVPIGVIGIIYEARPNVTVDVAALCLKSGNAAILRGGKEITRSCAALTDVIRQALHEAGLPDDAIQVIADPDRAYVEGLLRLDRFIDVIIPRGGAALHRFCREHATIPVITGGIGVCHAYVDSSADLALTVPIIHNAKVQRPSVCNSLDTLLVHRAIAAAALPPIVDALAASGVDVRADPAALAILGAGARGHGRVTAATAADFGTEFMALIISVRIVDSLDEAIDHIVQYGSGHSEAVLAEDPAVIDAFVTAVDASALFVNASTRFNDGAELGLGAEIAVSTQKLHARGPMALQELTTFKWIVVGHGQVRG
jgi:glutamate-5-semialdehyde dehydrogenase